MRSGLRPVCAPGSPPTYSTAMLRSFTLRMAVAPLVLVLTCEASVLQAACMEAPEPRHRTALGSAAATPTRHPPAHVGALGGRGPPSRAACRRVESQAIRFPNSRSVRLVAHGVGVVLRIVNERICLGRASPGGQDQTDRPGGRETMGQNLRKLIDDPRFLRVPRGGREAEDVQSVRCPEVFRL